jgi:hypothetical protein
MLLIAFDVGRNDSRVSAGGRCECSEPAPNQFLPPEPASVVTHAVNVSLLSDDDEADSDQPDRRRSPAAFPIPAMPLNPTKAASEAYLANSSQPGIAPRSRCARARDVV